MQDTENCAFQLEPSRPAQSMVVCARRPHPISDHLSHQLIIIFHSHHLERCQSHFSVSLNWLPHMLNAQYS